MRNLYRKRPDNNCLTCEMDAKECHETKRLSFFQGGKACCELCDHRTYVNVESTKLERKLRDALNRICKLVPSVKRISELDRIAVELEAEADERDKVGAAFGVDHEGLAADALYLRRLEYDLVSMREAKATVQPKKQSTMRASSKYEASQWPRGERP